MIDYEHLKEVVVTGLSKYLNCPVIRSNQNEEPPTYPYVSYTIITPLRENKGTYGEYGDGMHRKPFTQTWSITILSDNDSESINLATKAYEWLDHVGTVYLKDNDVDVQSVGNMGNRDNFLTVEYEYRNGFDVVFWLMNEVDNPAEETGYIETVQINDKNIEMPPTDEELINKLSDRLSGR